MSDPNLIIAICIEALEEIAEYETDENGINSKVAAKALQRIKQLEKLEQPYYNHIERKGT